MKKFSLKVQFIIMFLIISMIPLLVVSLFQLYGFHNSISDNINTQSNYIVARSAEEFEIWIQRKITQLNEILKAHPEFKTVDRKKTVSILKYLKEIDTDIESASVTDKNGVASTTEGGEMSITDRDYFINMRDKIIPVISNVVTSKVSGNKVIVVAVPIVGENGGFEGSLVCAINITSLNNIIDNMKSAKKGYGILMDKDGIFIQHPEKDVVTKSYKEYSNNIVFKNAFEKEILVNNNGKAVYNDDNKVKKIVSYATVPSTGWKLILVSNYNEIFSGVSKMMLISWILIAMFLAAIAIISFIFSRQISKPIESAVNHIKEVASGDYSREVPVVFLERKDEIGQLANAIKTLITDQSQLLAQIKQTSFNLNDTAIQTSSISEEMFSSSQSQADSMQDLKDTIGEMGRSIYEVTENINEIASNIGTTSQSSKEIGESASAIAVKADDVTKAISNVMVSIQQISASIELVSQNSKTAKDRGKETEDVAQKGNDTVTVTIEEMEKINVAINGISENIKVLGESSAQIGQIVEVIDDIAEQTNLLALNASIEAARAGEHGRGFAVVATAIGNLAEKSSEATKEIAKMIKQESKIVNDTVIATNLGVKEVESGVALVKKTGKAFQQIYSAVQSTKEMIDAIADSINEQEKATENVVQSILKVNSLSNEVTASASNQLTEIKAITDSIETINAKTQNVASACEEMSAGSEEIFATSESISEISGQISAGSEETAKSAETLSSFSKELEDLVLKFVIK